MIFIADPIACSTCFGHHYAHHQELENIIQMVAACCIWCLVFKLSVWCGGSNHLYNTLELLIMGIVVPETCWESNRICNINHLLHLVGILFPHIIDDARSNSLQIHICLLPVLHIKPTIKYSHSTKIHYISVSVVGFAASLGLNKSYCWRLRRILNSLYQHSCACYVVTCSCTAVHVMWSHVAVQLCMLCGHM